MCVIIHYLLRSSFFSLNTQETKLLEMQYLRRWGWVFLRNKLFSRRRLLVEVFVIILHLKGSPLKDHKDIELFLSFLDVFWLQVCIKKIYVSDLCIWLNRFLFVCLCVKEREDKEILVPEHKPHTVNVI